MANHVLFMSSCMMLLLHCIALYAFGAPVILQYVYILGSFTSLWNHGTSCTSARWSDRSVMVVGLGVDIWFIFRLKGSVTCIILLSISTTLSLVSYGCAKRFRAPFANIFHIYSHMFVCMTHFSILLLLYCIGSIH